MSCNPCGSRGTPLHYACKACAFRRRPIVTGAGRRSDVPPKTHRGLRSWVLYLRGGPTGPSGRKGAAIGSDLTDRGRWLITLRASETSAVYRFQDASKAEESEALPWHPCRGVQCARLPPTAVGRCSDARLESVVLPSPPARLFFTEKLSKLHPESLSDMPQRNNRWIPLSQFETAHVGSVYPHPLGKLGL
jgi:hypothetical protein